MAQALSMRSVRGSFASVIVFFVLAVAPGEARADDCLDASDEARSLLKERRLLDARSKLRVCAGSRCDEEVRTLCGERLAEVSERLPTVIFDAKDATGTDVPRVKLKVDGVDWSDGPVGAEITLDPGVHVFVFDVPDASPPIVVERRLVLVEREKGRREHVVLGPSLKPISVPPPVTPAPAVVTSPLRTAGWFTLGGAAVSLGIGAAFGVLAITKNDDARCDAANVCDDPRSRHDARVAATISTVGIVSGVVLAGAGVGLVLLGGRRSGRTASTSAQLQAGGFSVATQW